MNTAPKKTDEVSHSVLIVDDDPDVREILKDIFCGSAPTLRVVQAADGAEAIRKVANQKFAVMVTDLRMPKVNGGALLQELTKLDPQKRPDATLVLSGYPEECAFSTLENVTFLEKPADPDVLSAYLKEALRVKQPQEMVSILGQKYLSVFQDAVIQVLDITFGIRSLPRMIAPAGLTDKTSVQAYIQFQDKTNLGVFRVVLDAGLTKALMKNALANATAEEAPKAIDAVGELVNQAFGIGKAHLSKLNLVLKPVLPVLKVGDLTPPEEYKMKRPAVSYCSSTQGGLQVELMILRALALPS